MKKLISCIVLIFITFITTGCSFKGCVNCFGSKFKEAVACSCEFSGKFNDCFTPFSCSEGITDCLFVAPCFYMAGCTRECTLESIGCDSGLRKNLVSVMDKCKVNASYNAQTIYTLDNYYKVTIIITVEAYEKLKDVIVLFSATDSNNNKIEQYELYIKSRIASGPYKTESAEITFTFKYAENRVSCSANNYGVRINIIDVYGRV